MKIATIGTGSIVEGFIDAVNQVEGAQCVGVYSRNFETGKTLADKFGISNVFTDLDEMLKSEEIDFIYVASPNSLHFEHTRKALENNKHVICEKPFTSTLKETEELVKLAKDKNLFLFEAITVIHMPNFTLLKEQVKRLGKVKLIQTSYTQYSSRYDLFKNGQTPNVFNPAFSGGALMDLNIYNIHFVVSLVGQPNEVKYFPNLHENGIDTAGVLILKYPDLICECTAAKDVHGINSAQIHGENGFINIKNGANGMQEFTIYINGELETFNIQDKANRMYYETHSFYEMYKNNEIEKCHQLLDHTRSVMKVLYDSRLSAGIKFSADEK